MANNSDAGAPPPLTTDSQLQVGIEIEFVAPPDTAWDAAHLRGLDRRDRTSLSQDACLHRLAGSLHAAGLPACYQITTTPLQCPRRNPLRDATPPDAVVVLAGGLTKCPPYRRWIACELNSPILSEADVFTTGLPPLGAALTALHGADISGPPHISLCYCGLHVHLSPDVPGGCTVAYAQRLLTLALLLDQPLLQPLCDPPRFGSLRPFPYSAMFGADFVPRASSSRRRQRSSLLFSSRARAHLPSSFAAAEARVLALIWRDDATWDDLRQVLEHRRPGADPLSVAPVLCKHMPALGGGGRANTTVEFRHAQTSFSHRFVREWTRLVLAIGRVALLPVDDYRRALTSMWEAAGRGQGRGEGVSMAVLRELSDAAEEAGMPGGGLDLAYWTIRYAEMRTFRNPDIDQESKAVLDEDGLIV
ncbi:hypothetical protein ISF_04183 [Cordyceps fumosorosea ARSEF 2679]|uniref:Glutamate--cysteine ligase n=1 Tax=Cordyceps fumosorosea (strain ARSEF 2679) TaxID=1081104 RepID=A0A167XBP3_CORFA|nr:hypothetical protein ISF_04183 [Cordyceps fumosorosea ARSEF 2679]OAA64773.1 hypothetical protein ISF_04183 [Cordyceps fumosorosea ARSEF 2679]